MKKQTKKLLKINNKAEKAIHKNNDKIYTDMIVYLRGSDMTELNQEKVREDLIEMILQGQERGEDIEKVIGENYKEICDEIIDSMPKRTKTEKLWSAIELSLSIVWILGFIAIGKTIITNYIGHEKHWNLILSIGDIINMAIIIFVAIFLVEYVCKTAFKSREKNKVISFIKTWVISMAFLGATCASVYYLNYTVVKVPMLLGLGAVFIVFVIDKVLASYVE